MAILREKSVRYGFFNILADDEVRQGLKEFADCKKTLSTIQSRRFKLTEIRAHIPTTLARQHFSLLCNVPLANLLPGSVVSSLEGWIS